MGPRFLKTSSSSLLFYKKPDWGSKKKKKKRLLTITAHACNRELKQDVANRVVSSEEDEHEPFF